MGLVADIFGFIAQREQAGLDKEQWKIKKQQLDMAIEQRDLYLNTLKSLPPEQQKLGVINQELLGKTIFYDNLIKKLAGGGQEKQPPPPTFEETGEAFRPTQEMLPKQPLSGQIANQQLFGGMSPQNMMMDMFKKETGIGESMEPVQTKEIYDPVTKQMRMGQILRNGQTRWLSDPTGNPLIVPPDVEWKEMVIGNQKIEIGFDKKGNVIQQNGMPLIRSNIPQNQQFLRGLAGGPTGQAAIPVPPGGFPAGTILPETVKPEGIQLTGPRGEQSQVFVNPLIGGPAGITPSKGGLPGIQTKPPQAVTVGVAQQTEMMKSGLEALKKVKDSIFDSKTGKINRKNLFNAAIPFGGMPRSEGKRVGDLIGAALNAIRIASTGAAFSPKELEQLKAQYIPAYLANDQQVYDQWDQMTRFVQGMLQQMDPNEVFTKNQQKEFDKLMNIPKKGGMGLKPESMGAFKMGQTVEKNGITWKYKGNDIWERQ